MRAQTQTEDREKLLSCLGLCRRAGKTVIGVPMICEALSKSGRAAPCLVIEAEDTSDNTHKRLTDKCDFYKVRHVRIKCSGEQLARALGKTSFVGAVAIADRSMTAMLEKYL